MKQLNPTTNETKTNVNKTIACRYTFANCTTPATANSHTDTEETGNSKRYNDFEAFSFLGLQRSCANQF